MRLPVIFILATIAVAGLTAYSVWACDQPPCDAPISDGIITPEAVDDCKKKGNISISDEGGNSTEKSRVLQCLEDRCKATGKDFKKCMGSASDIASKLDDDAVPPDIVLGTPKRKKAPKVDGEAGIKDSTTGIFGVTPPPNLKPDDDHKITSGQ